MGFDLIFTGVLLTILITVPIVGLINLFNNNKK